MRNFTCTAFLVLIAPVVVPLIISYIHHSSLLRWNQCILLGYQDHVERYCRSTPMSKSMSMSIFGLSDKGGLHLRRIGAHVPTLMELSEFISSVKSPSSVDNTRTIINSNVSVEWDEKEMGWKVHHSTAISTSTSTTNNQQQQQSPSKGSNDPIAIVDYNLSRQKMTLTPYDNHGSPSETLYGFRRNEHKITKSQHNTSIPLGTGILLAMNIGFFFWLWNSRIDPNNVALNGQIYQDFGRAITGNLSHFEIWHLGFNMMSLSSLGPNLETKHGSIPLLLWTISFLPVVTLVVVGLYHGQRRSFIATRYTLGNNTTTTTTSSSTISSSLFPSMVGFSGILFVWMVVSTLDGQQSCPIFFLPSLCFDTWELGGIRVSLGPLVQLFFLQLVLPRVSFLGHLAGILVGFLWYWKLFPSLEWFQPCILFPFLWILCKSLSIYHNNGLYFMETRSGSRLGMTIVSDDMPITRRRLVIVQIMLVIHMMLQYFLIVGLCNSLFVSELLLIIILFMVIRSTNKHKNERRYEFLGVIGRGYVVLVGILLITDGLTLGSWLATWNIWTNATTACSLLIGRDILFIITIGLVVHTLNMIDETRSCGGTWIMIIWPIAQYYQIVVELLERIYVSQISCFDNFDWYKQTNEEHLELLQQHNSLLETNESNELV